MLFVGLRNSLGFVVISSCLECMKGQLIVLGQLVRMAYYTLKICCYAFSVNLEVIEDATESIMEARLKCVP